MLASQESPSWGAYSAGAYVGFLETCLHGLAAQASCRGDGLHAPFGSYGIEAVSVAPLQTTETEMETGRVRARTDYYVGLEEIARSVRSRVVVWLAQVQVPVELLISDRII